MGTTPTVGMTIAVHNTIGVITKVRPAGTVDVRLPDGTHVRVSGLPFR